MTKLKLKCLSALLLATAPGMVVLADDAQSTSKDTADDNLIYNMVSSSPIRGDIQAFNGGDLLVNVSSINEDLAILKVRQRDDFMIEKGTVYPRSFLSGSFTGELAYYHEENESAESDVNVSGAELDVMSLIGPWSSVFMSLEYDDSNQALSETVSGDRIGNSNFYLNHALAVIGDLSKTPFYGSIGQLYVPFGSYSTYMWTNPITKDLGRTSARAVTVGYSHGDVLLNAYALRGDVGTSEEDQDNINNFGVGAYLSGKVKDVSLNYGGGWIYDIADSSAFIDYFEDNDLDFVVDHNVPAVDFFVQGTYDRYVASLEYVAATESFDSSDISYNGHGAQPSAFHSEFDINLPFCHKTANVGVAYDRGWESEQIDLPEKSYIAVFNASFLQNTVTSVEYRHNELYDSSQDLATDQLLVEWSFYF